MVLGDLGRCTDEPAAKKSVRADNNGLVASVAIVHVGVNRLVARLDDIRAHWQPHGGADWGLRRDEGARVKEGGTGVRRRRRIQRQHGTDPTLTGAL